MQKRQVILSGCDTTFKMSTQPEMRDEIRDEIRDEVRVMMTQEQKDFMMKVFADKGWTFMEIIDNATDPDSYDPGVIIPQDMKEDECPLCLCRPCITHEQNRQRYWPQQQQPANRINNRERRLLYKKFWTMLYHRRVWRDARYLARKEEALGRDGRRQNFIWHRRDIMPNCVTTLVRQWYPNPQTIPYMGHMWE